MAAALSVAYTVTPVPAGVSYIIEATGMVSAGKSFAGRSEYKLIAVLAAAAASPANILAAYTALYGALISGRKIFFRMRAISSTGFSSGLLETSKVIT